jgi:hypothetical protein
VATAARPTLKPSPAASRRSCRSSPGSSPITSSACS